MRRTIASLRLREKRGAYLLSVRLVGGEPMVVGTDLNLGSVMSAWSAVLREVRARETGVPVASLDWRISGITLSRFVIEPLVVAPWRWRIEMESGPYRFTCNVDAELEHVTDAFMAAMRFFGMKYGLMSVYADETRSVAREAEGLEGVTT